MAEDKVRIFAENFARSMDRRGFIKKTGGTIFAGMAALASGHLLLGSASASTVGHRKPPLVNRIPNCSPPGPYCNLNGVNEPNGCHGASCFQHLYQGEVLQCRLYYYYYPQTGCWTSVSNTGTGYWTCCDCECLNSSGLRAATCGCAQLSGDPKAQPTPRPDGPAGE